jgi:hypothetical protein
MTFPHDHSKTLLVIVSSLDIYSTTLLDGTVVCSTMKRRRLHPNRRCNIERRVWGCSCWDGTVYTPCSRVEFSNSWAEMFVGIIQHQVHLITEIIVTNNTTRVRIGYRIYSLWRFTAAHITVTENILTLALAASITHCEHWTLLLPETNWRRLTSKADGRGLTNSALCCLLYITRGRSDRKPGLPTIGCYATNTGHPTVGCYATQQYWCGEHIHGTVAATVT